MIKRKNRARLKEKARPQAALRISQPVVDVIAFLL
jgi:hypothetical protein